MDFIEKLIDNPTTKVDCKYCGELTKVYKSDKSFLFVCTGCKNKQLHVPKYPTSIWTLCKSCGRYTQTEKYKIRVECLICGDYLNPRSPE